MRVDDWIKNEPSEVQQAYATLKQKEEERSRWIASYSKGVITTPKDREAMAEVDSLNREIDDLCRIVWKDLDNLGNPKG